jgi:hypothetical protein
MSNWKEATADLKDWPRCKKCGEDRLLSAIRVGRAQTLYCEVCSHEWQYTPSDYDQKALSFLNRISG